MIRGTIEEQLAKLVELHPGDIVFHSDGSFSCRIWIVTTNSNHRSSFNRLWAQCSQNRVTDSLLQDKHEMIVADESEPFDQSEKCDVEWQWFEVPIHYWLLGAEYVCSSRKEYRSDYT